MKSAAAYMAAATLAAIAAPSLAQQTPATSPVQVNPAGPSLCNAPAAPPLYLPAVIPDEPVPPKCINLAKNTTTCSTRVINEWNVKTKEHNDLKRSRIAEMNAYGRELQKYQHAATEYAMCEQNRVSELLPE
jgi:hypothetical protein